MLVLHNKTESHKIHERNNIKRRERKKGEKQFIHQNDLFAQYRTERSPDITGDLKMVLLYWYTMGIGDSALPPFSMT